MEKTGANRAEVKEGTRTIACYNSPIYYKRRLNIPDKEPPVLVAGAQIEGSGFFLSAWPFQ